MSDAIPRSTDELDHFRALLCRRARRLAKLCDMNAPAPVIAHEVLLVEAAAWSYAPEAMGSMTASRRLEEGRRKAGRCVGCGALTDDDDTFCAGCVACAESDEIDAEKED